MTTSAQEMERLVSGFARNIRALRSPECNEDEVRQEYIDAFWEALGWDVANRAHRTSAEKDVMVERRVRTIERQQTHSRPTDYIFRINGFAKFIVEAKKPTVDLRTDKDAILQAKTYAWGAQIPFAVLHNFEQFRLFDCTLKPYHGEPERGIVHDFDLRYEDYVTQWEVFWATFGRDAVAANSLDQLLARIKKLTAGRRLRGVDRMLVDLRGSEPFDKAFLAHLQDYRTRFAEAIYRANRSAFPEATTRHGAARLTEAVQRLIDRLVFMRVCEDRDITEYGSLRETLDRAAEERAPFYPLVVTDFRYYDQHYNGYLFKPHFSEQLDIPDALLAEFIRSLYLPEGPYRFDVIESDLLGIIYERFLASVLTVKQGHVTAEEKPEVRHAGGVYYTPRFVVNTIIRRVIGPKLEGRAPAQVPELKILDPACGSGSFLIAAFQYLMDHCVRFVTEHPQAAERPVAGRGKRKKKEAIAFRDADGQWHLAPDFRAELLTSCIYGVDIDAQAVEVTVMNLYLKMLEGQLPPNWQREWVEKQLLPPLDNNIRCGNSLLSQTDFDRWWENEHGALFEGDADVRFRMNPFDWTSVTRGFGRLLQDRQGFDCIIGNPPYIRVQELNKWAPDECEFYKWRYRSAKKGNYDIYVVFIERALELLAPGGLLGFICPHKFWQAAYGQGLRQLIADGRHLRSLIDFTDQQVFEGATTYTAIQVFSKEPNKGNVDYARIDVLEDGDAQCQAIDRGSRAIDGNRFHPQKPVGPAPWVFVKRAVADWMEKVQVTCARLEDICYKIAQGIVSGCDAAFYLQRSGKRFRSEQTNRDHEIESELLHPLLKGSVHIRRWLADDSQLSVLFPYQQSQGNWSLIPPSVMKQHFPKAFDYLLQCRGALERRERGRFAGPEFYQFSRPQNFDVMARPKVLVPAIARHAEYFPDVRGKYFYVGSGGGGGGAHAIVPKIKVDLRYLAGLLNTRYLDTYLKQVTTRYHSGWYAYSKLYVGQLPIKLPETAAEKRLAEQITQRVEQIIAQKQRLQAEGLSEQDRTRLERQVESYEEQIDDLVCRLYGVEALPG